MGAIPSYQSADQVTSRLQDAIIPALNRLLQNAFVQGSILKMVTLQVGSNQIPHGLNRKLQGWTLVRQRALANIYDTQDTNPSPQSTLSLVSDQVVTIDLYVF